MAIELPLLPFSKNALEPYISSETLNYHYGKHHNAYVVNTNNLIKESDLESASLEEIIKISSANPSQSGLFNNAAQVWNHTFYWNSLKNGGGGHPSGAIAQKIDSDFGSYEAFAKAFKETALGQFGSGWAWLVIENGILKITKTSNADTPVVHGIKPLLCIDVWEHAYYLDYQNVRAEYVDNVINHLLNWEFANKNLAL